MAKTIQALMDEEVMVAHTAGKATSNKGVLKAVDDRGILLTAEDAKDGPIRVFVPWAAILWVRAVGEGSPKRARGATEKPPGF